VVAESSRRNVISFARYQTHLAKTYGFESRTPRFGWINVFWEKTMVELLPYKSTELQLQFKKKKRELNAIPTIQIEINHKVVPPVRSS
jgi:hypothetical protein